MVEVLALVSLGVKGISLTVMSVISVDKMNISIKIKLLSSTRSVGTVLVVSRY